jgi:3-oxoacyl-(acyl-carrier-protein) synthase
MTLGISSRNHDIFSDTPQVNCDNPDPVIDHDIVRREPRALGPGPVLTCSFGFGGGSAART